MAKMLSNKNRAIHVSAFMERFPKLLFFLVERLKSLLKEQRKNHMSMMPLLLLMSKLVPDSDKIVIEQRVPLLNMLQHLVVSTPQSTRNVAARAVVTFMRESDLIPAACMCLHRAGNTKKIRQNDLHGAFVLATQLFRVGSSRGIEKKKSMEALCNALYNFVVNSDLERIVGTALSQLFVLARELYSESTFASRQWNIIADRVFNWIKTNTLRHERKIDVGVSNALENATSLMWLISTNEQTTRVDDLVSLLCEANISNHMFFITSASILPRKILSEQHVKTLADFLFKICVPSKRETLYDVAALELLASLNDSKILDLEYLLKISTRCRRFSSRNTVLKLVGLGVFRDGIHTMCEQSEWIEILDRYSRDDAALELRLGVLDALDTSSCLDILLKHAHESDKFACVLVHIWRISHRLLIDDDENVRRKMAYIMSRALKLRFSKNPLLCAQLALEKVRSIVSSHTKAQAILTDILVYWIITPCLSYSSSSDNERLFEDEPLNENYETLWHVRNANINADPRVRKVLNEFKERALPDLIENYSTGENLIRGDIYCALYACVSQGISLGPSFVEWFPSS